MEIPATTAYVIERPQRGTQVWALQRALGIDEDGVFGYVTEGKVATFQEAHDLDIDGKAGPATQSKLARVLERRVSVELPGGLLRGFVEGESGDKVAAVNWGVAGGVDCGYVQRRVYGPPYSDAAIRSAFDSLRQLKLLAGALAEWSTRYRMQGNGNELAWRLAALRHNYIYAADKIADVGIDGLSSYWTTEQTWVTVIGATFPDGDAVKTPLGWTQHYAGLPNDHGDPGLVTKRVTNWSP